MKSDRQVSWGASIVVGSFPSLLLVGLLFRLGLPAPAAIPLGYVCGTLLARAMLRNI